MFLKKLLYITTNLQGSGGVSRILSVKLNYLIEKFSYNIYVINSNQSNNDFFYDFNNQIKFYQITSKQLFKYKKELNALISNIKPDIIINCDNGFKGSLFPYIIKTSKPLIYERHCGKNIPVATLKERLKLMTSNLLLQKSIKRYHNFIVLNREEKKDWKNKNVQIIPNPLWLNVSPRSIIKDQKIAIAVGRHSYEKQYDKLIKIWKLVVEYYPNWILQIYGEQNKNISINRIVLEENLKDNIQLFDPVNDLEKIYSEASMLLSTSSSESFPLTFIEAMAYSLPVIAFNNHGSKSIIIDSKNGILVKENNINEYAQKVIYLIENHKERTIIGMKAMKSVKKFNMEIIMKKWHELFESLK